LATTGWEETALLGAAMAGEPDTFVRQLVETQLELAGRCAAQPEVLGRLSQDVLDELREGLAIRSRDPEADPRVRIAGGLALGPLGDPRFERRTGPGGDYLLPPVVEIAGGRYPIGDNDSFEFLGIVDKNHVPRHEVDIGPFTLGRFLVTNAEWALFMKAGGYEDERWWATSEARRWWNGETTAAGTLATIRHWMKRLRKDPEKVEELWKAGNWTRESYETLKESLTMSEAEFEEDLKKHYPGGKLREPGCWRDERFNNPAQPVVGVCWFEALAYASWLSAQTGVTYRLPTEAEWEAATRGREARLYSWGDRFDLLRGNVAGIVAGRTTPVGVFPEGDTPEGVSDLSGNVSEWTRSLFGPDLGEAAEFGYPYRADDGRENVCPDYRENSGGFRLALSGSSSAP
jgi:formylglycine-generating enzyme required for sulfatase activity